MKHINWFKPLKISFAVFTATIVSAYFSLAHEYWMVLTALTVMLCGYRMPFQRALLVVLIFCLALVSATLLGTQFKLAVFILLFMSGSIFLLYQARLPNLKYYLILYTFIVALVGLTNPDARLLRARIADVFIGGGIGLACSLFIFPFKPSAAFRSGVIPLLNQLRVYSLNLTNANKINLEKALISPPYPNWVYQSGFNPGLRAGFRFFLIHLEQIIDLYFSLQQYYENQAQLPDEFLKVLNNNSTLINMLTKYFVDNQLLSVADLDFTSDISAMEGELKKLIPTTIEMLDISPQYINISALVRIMTDIRKQLLQLLAALPAPI